MRPVPQRLVLLLLALMSAIILAGCQGISARSNVVPPPTPGQLSSSPVSVGFGNVGLGTSQTLTNTLTNTGQTSLNITAAGVSGAGFGISGLSMPTTLGAGQSVTFNVTFQPPSAGSTTGNVALTNTGSTTVLNIALSGTGVAPSDLVASPSSYSFGTVVVGSSATETEGLQNSGGQSLTITAATVTGAGFSISGLTLPLTLAPTQATSFTVKFAPTAAGGSNGTVSLTVTGISNTVDFAVSGTGASAAVVTPTLASITFTNITTGQTSSQTETLTNTGGVNTMVSAATASGTGFSVSGFTAGTLTPGQSMSFTVKYAPTTAGTSTGTVTVTSNASNPSLSIPLSGTAVTPATLAASPTSLTYTNITVGQTSNQTQKVTNTGGTSATISAVAAAGTGFSISGITPPVTLTPGQSTTFTVTFAPTSAGTFSGTVTVTSNASNPSLGIPLSGTAVVTPAVLTAVPTSLTYTNIAVGQTSNQTQKVTNTGGTSATISAVAASGTGYSISGITPPVTLTPGQSTSFTVTFAPTSAGTSTGTVTVTSNASNPSLGIPLSGTAVTPATLTASPTSLTYTNITTGQRSNQTQKVTNTGGTSATISAAAAAGTGFSISGITPPVTLTPGQSTTFTVTFAPTSAGTFSGTVTVTSNASNPSLQIPLSGTAIAPVLGTLAANPTTVAVPGSVVVGTSGTATGQLIASTASVTVSGVSVVGAEFTISGLAFPVTIPAGQSVNYTVKFTPTASGSASTTASFASNASNAPTGVGLTGTAIPAPVYTVGLSWTASTTLGINGYYIYRALYNTSTSTCGTYSKLNPLLPNVLTTYTDVNVTDGDTYCYEVTAVNSSDQESTDSNSAQAIIPAP
jgi:hypothetical protein